MTAPRSAQLAAATEALTIAAGVARRVQRSSADIAKLVKDDSSPVTVADFAVQAVVSLVLRRRLGDGVLIVGEEDAASLRQDSSQELRAAVIGAVRVALPEVDEGRVLAAIDACDHDASAERYWALDPVDGTKGFIRQQHYAIALALIEDRRPTTAVLACPNLSIDEQAPLDALDPRGTLLFAERAGGARQLAIGADTAQARPIHAATTSPGGAVRVCESVESSHSDLGRSAALVARLGQPGVPVRVDSQCKYALVARGQADAYLRLPIDSRYREKIWDHAAGALIAEEADARVSDADGVPLDFSTGTQLVANSGVICAPPELHRRLVDLLRDGQRSPR